MALWDIKGKGLGVPVWQLLGGKMRSRVRCYAHGSSREEARALVAKGYDAIKIGGGQNCLQNVHGKHVQVCCGCCGHHHGDPQSVLALTWRLLPVKQLFEMKLAMR
jgi:L-alanine-DL-glutamate epimerase-like enolase superfamily enzyme